MKTIGVFFGSRSPEHDVSIITGQLIISGLKGLGYNVMPVYLTKKGEWLLGEELGIIKAFTDPNSRIDSKKLGNYFLDLEESRGKLVFKKKGAFGSTVSIDLAFPAFHGSYGEDGTIQGLFEMFGIPYVGCDVASSAITMDKILTKQFYLASGIPTTKFVFFGKANWLADKNEVMRSIVEELKWPVFIKPARLGSSIGIAKVKEEKDLAQAIEVALHYDTGFLAEEAVEDLMDVTVALLGNEDPQTSELLETLFGDELYSYKEKYLQDGGTQLGKALSKIVIPARLDEKITKEIKELAVKIYELFGCSGTARVDFLYDKTSKKCYANEINTLPGTLYHHLWKASGVEFGELLERLIALARERSEAKKKIALTFESEILKQANSTKLRLKKNGV